MNTILVTGGTGFIGSHTVVELQSAGFDVVVVDNLCNSTTDVLDNIASITGQKPRFYRYDLNDQESVNKLFSEEPEIKAVIHFAAHKAVGESTSSPLKYYKNNVLSTIHLLEAMKEHGVKHIIFSSSATVYGQPEVLPATENTPTMPATSPYGNTKQICEEVIRDTVSALSGSMDAIMLRYFNPIGAHLSGKIGELPTGVPNNLMPFITQTAIGKREKLSVFGNDYNTKDGTAVRDYIHVVDLAKAHVKGTVRLIEQKNKTAFEVFNLGTGMGLSVMDIIQSFEKTTGEKLNYAIEPRRAGDVEAIYASTTLANEELGWTAELSIDEMTSSAWQWEKNIKNQ